MVLKIRKIFSFEGLVAIIEAGYSEYSGQWADVAMLNHWARKIGYQKFNHKYELIEVR